MQVKMQTGNFTASLFTALIWEITIITWLHFPVD